MATVLDLGLVQAFDVVYPVILVFALVFALLQKTKIIGDNVAINSVVSVVVALTILLSRPVVDVINFIVPWFTVFAIFLLLLLLMFNIFGARESDVFEFVKNDKGVGWTLIGISLAIVIAGFATVFGQQFTEASFQDGTQTNITDGTGVATSNFDQNINNTLFHPKMLGFVTLFIIVIFAVGMLTGNFN